MTSAHNKSHCSLFLTNTQDFFSSFQNNLFPFRADSNAGNIVYDKSKIMIAFNIDADGLGLELISCWIWLLQLNTFFFFYSYCKRLNWGYRENYFMFLLLPISLNYFIILKIIYWITICFCQWISLCFFLKIVMMTTKTMITMLSIPFKPTILITLTLLLDPIQTYFFRKTNSC